MRTKKITFGELHKFVAGIDYVVSHDYMEFTVENGSGKRDFCAGIGYIDPNHRYEPIVTSEVQFLMEVKDDGLALLDMQDPNDMAFEKIGDMLRKECGIDDDCTIRLHLLSKKESDKKSRPWVDDVPMTAALEEKLEKTLEECEEEEKRLMQEANAQH